MKSIIIKISFLYILLFNYIFSANNPDGTLCSTYSDCFDCIACGEQNVSFCTCDYNVNGCYNSNIENYLVSNNLFTIFLKCTDTISKEIQKNYCGSSNITISDNKAEITIPEVNSLYGRNNLYCSYTYLNSEKDLFLTIVSTYIENKGIRIQYSYYNDNDEEYTGFFSNGVNYNFKDFKIINFFVYIPESFQLNPFTIKIESEKNGINLPLLIGLIVVLVVCAATIIVVIIIINKYKENQEEAEILRLQEERNEELKKKIERQKEIKKKIENLFANGGELEAKKYIKEYEQKYGNNCTICLEQFVEEQSIINLTPCHHIFHKECLHKWLCDNLEHPKCPNCNHILVEIEKEIKKEENVSNIAVNNNNENTRIQQNPNESINTNHDRNTSNAMLNINSNLSRNILNDNNNINNNNNN